MKFILMSFVFSILTIAYFRSFYKTIYIISFFCLQFLRLFIYVLSTWKKLL